MNGVIKTFWIVMHFHEDVGFIEQADDFPFFVDNGHLRNIGGAHSLHRGQQRVVRPHCYYFASLVAMADKIAQVAVRRAADKALLGHPKIVIHL